ncbi:nucleotide-binding domain-containing protein [Butyrivibrio sp. AE2032]|uniref:nucleotide-binding domain-containing protein n=1 Tax=Butyrivibrio sp. AE2032 TaxID=1458463 RepID=UPI00055969A4|nr:nucleotidyltransferase [Butyrivibrio sp. AE2032]
MYDMSSRFIAFYSSCVVLPQNKQNKLYELKDINLQRLKDGLEEYNDENGTSFCIVESCVQGSVAMSTVVQNDENDYDIDVAVVFDFSDISEIGAQAARNIVADALRRRTKQFDADPEVKTSCVRVKYAAGYHIDFAIYRRSWDEYNCCWKYEHAGKDWSERELRGLTDWFKMQNDYSDGKLRQVVRLSKMFCNSRDSWVNMPSGLLQTVLCDENLQADCSRIDELFYYTMKAVIERLDLESTVSAPVDNGRNLTPRLVDIKKITNWKNRLKSKIEDLDILFEDCCSEEDAFQAWYGFFNHDYWREQINDVFSNISMSAGKKSNVRTFNDTEEFIEDIFPVCIKYSCRVTCKVSGDGWTDTLIRDYFSKFRRFIPHNFTVKCSLTYTDCPGIYSVYWKVKNVGVEAERKNCLRGRIEERGKSIKEPTSFYGYHYIECYIIKDKVCVARTRVGIPIDRR